MCRRRQHQGIAQLCDLPAAVCGNDLDARQPADIIVDVDLAGLGDQVVDSIKRHLEKVVPNLWLYSARPWDSKNIQTRSRSLMMRE
jgi:hypothetical protein